MKGRCSAARYVIAAMPRRAVAPLAKRCRPVQSSPAQRQTRPTSANASPYMLRRRPAAVFPPRKGTGTHSQAARQHLRASDSRRRSPVNAGHKVFSNRHTFQKLSQQSATKPCREKEMRDEVAYREEERRVERRGEMQREKQQSHSRTRHGRKQERSRERG